MFFQSLSTRTFSFVRNYAKIALVPKGKFSRREEKPPNEHLDAVLETCSISKPQDWRKLREYVLSDKEKFYFITPASIDGVIMNHISNKSRIDLAKSYINFLQSEKVKPNIATTSRYMKLLYDTRQEKLSKANENEILSLYEDIQKSYPVLDSRTLDNVILALSLTKDWKKCLDIMQEVKKTSTVSTSAYYAIAAAAFANKEEALAWELLKEIMALERPLGNTTAYMAYLNSFKKLRSKKSIFTRLEKLFLFFKENEISCPEDVVNTIIENFKVGSKTTVNLSGQCQVCSNKVVKLQLTDEEFSSLSKQFFNDVLIGKDIFIKTNPKEMSMFQEFVNNMGTHDVVLDGLNIAYSAGEQSMQILSANVAAVVSHFVEEKKTVLVLGRVHMNKWPKQNWNYIKRNASVFLTQNISQDDPYLLYCALKSGKDTIIVSRDLMRGHKFLLKDRKHKVLFNRWLSQRQYFLTTIRPDGKVIFRVPPPFTPIVQRSENFWHIPYEKEQEGDNTEQAYHKEWFCVNCDY